MVDSKLSKVDISNLPSPEELEAQASSEDISHLPSPDQLSAQEAPEGEHAPEWSKSESLGQGALQGATAGFSDELGGIEGALFEKAADVLGKGPQSGKSLEELYREYRDFQRQRNKQAEESNKGSYLAGNILGGVGSAAVAPGALGAKTLSGAAKLGAAAGLGSSEAELADPENLELGRAAKDVAIGTGLGAGSQYLGNKAGSLIFKKEARELGRQGQTLFGEGAQKAIKQETQDFAESIVNSIKNEKGKLGDTYDAIIEANKNQKIDLNEFVNNLKQRAAEFDTSLPEQARDKKAIMDLVAKVTEGPEFNKPFVTGFKPGQTVEAVPSAREALESEGAQLVESQRQLGKKASFEINPSEDENLLTRISRTEDQVGSPLASAKTVPNTPGTPAYSKISPIEETRLVREGGTLTPDIETAKTLRTNLGKIANEKNLSSSGEKFADQTYSELSDTLKNAVPKLGDTDTKYNALLKAGRKLGIKGNDEDVVRVLEKMTSSNQGKEIVVEQALQQLDKVNPQLSKQIRTQAASLDQKAEMIDQVSQIGNYNIVNPKQLLWGLAKDFGALRTAAGNVAGLAERKLVQTPAGTLVQKSIQSVPVATATNPFTQERVQQKYNPSEMSKLSTNLYNATDDSLKEVASSLKQTPGLEFYAEHLDSAIRTQNEGEKNRAIFLILQNPKARKLITPDSQLKKEANQQLTRGSSK